MKNIFLKKKKTADAELNNFFKFEILVLINALESISFKLGHYNL